LKPLVILKSWIIFLNNGKKTKYSLLAPTEGKILVSWGSAHKIGMMAGTNAS
jgi:hypothetical protein